MVIRNLTTQTVLADRATVARGIVSRAVGLLGRASLTPGEALILPRCGAIHTWFMRFTIDVIFLKTVQGSRFKVVVEIVEGMKPFRFACAWGADTVVELAPGTLAVNPLKGGEMLDIQA